jgi:hypothetical protein
MQTHQYGSEKDDGLQLPNPQRLQKGGDVSMIARDHTGIPVQTADGNGNLTGPASKDYLRHGQITSSAWEGWWWEDFAEESASPIQGCHQG